MWNDFSLEVNHCRISVDGEGWFVFLCRRSSGALFDPLLAHLALIN